MNSFTQMDKSEMELHAVKAQNSRLNEENKLLREKLNELTNEQRFSAAERIERQIKTFQLENERDQLLENLRNLEKKYNKQMENTTTKKKENEKMQSTSTDLMNLQKTLEEAYDTIDQLEFELETIFLLEIENQKLHAELTRLRNKYNEPAEEELNLGNKNLLDEVKQNVYDNAESESLTYQRYTQRLSQTRIYDIRTRIASTRENVILRQSLRPNSIKLNKELTIKEETNSTNERDKDNVYDEIKAECTNFPTSQSSLFDIRTKIANTLKALTPRSKEEKNFKNPVLMESIREHINDDAESDGISFHSYNSSSPQSIHKEQKPNFIAQPKSQVETKREFNKEQVYDEIDSESLADSSPKSVRDLREKIAGTVESVILRHQKEKPLPNQRFGTRSINSTN